jgi:hypothetical protein
MVRKNPNSRGIIMHSEFSVSNVQFQKPVVPHKAVAEVSEIENL